MTATPTHTTPQPTGPPPRRRPSMAWAFAASFVVILLLVGVAAWLLPSDEAPVADEPATPTTVTAPATTSEAIDEPASTPPTDPVAPVIADGWQEVATPTEQPWVQGILQIEPLPGGGYVATGRLEDRFIMWSPNGVDWHDGDPQRLVEGVEVSTFPRSLAAVGNQVVVLHHTSQDEIAVSIGDPRTGTWERVPLDATGVEGDLRGVRLAANDQEVLVAAYAIPAPDDDGQAAATTQVVVWLVDATQGTASRNSFSVPATFPEHEYPRNEDPVTPRVEWVEERWIMIAVEDAGGPEGYEQRNTLWTSLDGRSWSQVAMAEGMGGVHSIRAGPSGVAAASCTGFPGSFGSPEDGFWYSSDGLEWSSVPVRGWSHANPVTGSWGDYGFVVGMPGDDGSGVQLVAADGSEMVVVPSPFDGAFAAAASGDTLLASSWQHNGLWLYQEPTGK